MSGDIQQKRVTEGRGHIQAAEKQCVWLCFNEDYSSTSDSILVLISYDKFKI